MVALATVTTAGTALATGSITKVKSGLISSDQLTSGNLTAWTFDGTATSKDYYEDSQGLHLGVQSPQSGQWSNFYTYRLQHNAFLYHAKVTNPYNSVSDGVFDIGLYVEGSNYTPYVSCETYSDGTGIYWIVGQSSNAGASYNVLYSSAVSSMPNTQDCTIITNGSNYLQVYIGGKDVYSSTSLSLGMPTPLIPYFQDDTSSASMRYATFYDFYSTSGEKIKVVNNTASATNVSLIGSSGQVLASSAVSAGTATINVGKYTFPLSATINVYDSNNNVLASSPETIYGGDEFSVSTTSPITVPQQPTGLSATAVSSSQINLAWTAPADDGGSPITGYEIDRSGDGGSSWSTIVSNTATSGTTYSDTGLAHSTAYTYRVSAINSAGTGAPSSYSSATTYNTIPSAPTGLGATAASASEIDLVWNAPGDSGGSTITGYMVERSANGGSSWSVISADTGNTTAAYHDAGLASNTTYSYRVSAINAIGTGSPSNTASATTTQQISTIRLLKSGLLASDPLNNETETEQQLKANPGYWTYGGDAPNENAPYDFFRDLLGLHIGAQAPQDGIWAGYYAESQNTNGMLFHAIVNTPVSFVSNTTNPEWYENGLYVQRASLPVNYVTCFSLSGAWGIEWVVASVTGNNNQAVNETTLWVDNSTNQPTTRDCTIITNGTNYLKVYLDGNMVYTSKKLNLQMPEPFNSYLEPQSSYAGKLLNGTYTDYYATAGEYVKVIGLPSSATRADLVDSQGNVLASASVTSGSAVIPVGAFDFPLQTSILAYDSSNSLVAETPGLQKIYGGDTYSAQ